VHPFDAERIHQTDRIVGKQCDRIGTGSGPRVAVTTGVVAQHAVAIDKSGDGDVPHGQVRHEAVTHHYDPSVLGTVETVGDLDTVHQDFPELFVLTFHIIAPHFFPFRRTLITASSPGRGRQTTVS